MSGARELVLIAGWGMPGGVFAELAGLLAARRRVTVRALPGFDGQAAVSPYDLPGLAAALWAGLETEAVDLAGWSLGGAAAAAMAAASPERVKSLCLIASNPKFVADNSWPGVAGEVLDAFASSLRPGSDLQSGSEQLRPEQLLMRFAALLAQGDARGKPVLARLRAELRAAPVPEARVLAAGLDLLRAADWRRTLAAAACPVSVLLGGRDALTPPDLAGALANVLPKARVYEFAEAGHALFLSRPEEAAAAILEAAA